MADRAHRWHERRPDRRRTGCRQDPSGRRMVRQAYDEGAVVLYGRCDEDLGAPYQPFAEALRSLVPCLGASQLRGLRGVEALLPLVPGLTDVLPDLAAPTRADPDTERYALFDAVVALLGVASASAPVVLILDDLHWAAKPTLLLLRHLLRFGEHARVQIVGTYRSTDLDRTHPLAAMLADLHRDGHRQPHSAQRSRRGRRHRLRRRGRLRRRRASPGVGVGHGWQSVLPDRGPAPRRRKWRPVGPEHPAAGRSRSGQSPSFAACRRRRTKRLPQPPSSAVGSPELVERVVGDDLVDAFDEACKAGLVIEEPGGHYRFNHAIVRQSLLAELASVRRMRLHQRIAATLETSPAPTTSCWPNWLTTISNVLGRETRPRPSSTAGVRRTRRWPASPTKAPPICTTRPCTRWRSSTTSCPTATSGWPSYWSLAARPCWPRVTWVRRRARCRNSKTATLDSARLAAWATCFDGQLSMLIHPERLDEIEAAVGAAAETARRIGRRRWRSQGAHRTCGVPRPAWENRRLRNRVGRRAHRGAARTGTPPGERGVGERATRGAVGTEPGSARGRAVS